MWVIVPTSHVSLTFSPAVSLGESVGRGRGRFGRVLYARSGKRSILAEPVTDAEVFFNLTAFVTVLVGFVRATFDVPQVMLRISDQFGQDLRSFAHGFSIPLSEMLLSLNNANFPMSQFRKCITTEFPVQAKRLSCSVTL